MLALLKLAFFFVFVFLEDPPSPTNLCTYTKLLYNYLYKTLQVDVNFSEELDEDDKEILNILNEFLNTSNEVSVSPNKHRYTNTLIHQKEQCCNPR